jgi:hypothetical protein
VQPEATLVHQHQVADVADHDRRNAGKHLREESCDRGNARRRELREVQAGEDADASRNDQHAEAQCECSEDGVLQPQLGAGRRLGEERRLQRGKRVRKDAQDDVQRGRDDEQQREAAQRPEDSGADVTLTRSRHHDPPEAHRRRPCERRIDPRSW